jgi:hypothetical protein
LLEEHAAKIDNATAIAMVVRAPDGVLTVLWSHQALSQLLFASEALAYDVRQACFNSGGDDDG